MCIILLSQFFKESISTEVKNTPKEYQYGVRLQNPINATTGQILET